VNVRLGSDGLRLLELGLSPEAALTSLLQEDSGAAKRQVAGIDARGRESPALLVPAPADAEPWSGFDIRVDQHPDPVAELRRISDLLHERYRQALADAESE
jgi:uncharacterized Ntn-hydrolase superfamily protein